MADAIRGSALAKVGTARAAIGKSREATIGISGRKASPASASPSAFMAA
jgi:hypothetical protein